VVAQVKHRIDQFAAGGGFILATCNHLIDAPPELVQALFDTAREYGRYSSSQ
jgi:uroporphyrinogen-III decarboxylase